MHWAVVRAAMRFYEARYWRPVNRLAAEPEPAQTSVLLRLLRKNAHTGFGSTHGLPDVRTYAEFARRVPVHDYEMLRPYVDEQRRTGRPALTKDAPAFYAQTSGTTGAPKFIPITPGALKSHREEQALFSFLQYRACPAAFDGRALGIMGAAVEGRLDTGQPVGSVSGHLYQSLPGVVTSRFVIPPIVTTIADYRLKYLAVLQLALACPDISYLGAPNPSTFLRLLDLLNAERQGLLDALATGRYALLEQLPDTVRSALQSRLRANPQRARQLARMPELTFTNVWPAIRLVTTWMGGSCGIALSALRTKLPDAAAVMELGYQSSEFRGTLALELETSAGLPALHHHFFEFAPVAAWDAGQREVLPLAGLTTGEQYYVLVTTEAGLYRYFMNDIVEVTGLYRRTPLLRFVQKGRGVTSLTGEKLYEAQVIRAVQEVARHEGLATAFFLAVAEEQTPGYRLFVETDAALLSVDEFARHVDRRLGELNIEYHGKRASGRLQPLTLTPLKPGAAEAYKAAHVRAGQREGQFKPVVLQYRNDLTWDVYGYGQT